MSRIVETDNFGGDYPDESFVLFPMEYEDARRIAQNINDVACLADPNTRRHWKVVDDDYKLQPGFEP